MNVHLPIFTGTCTGSLLSPPSSPQTPGMPLRIDSSWRTPWLTSRSMSPAPNKKNSVQPEKLRLRQQELGNDDDGLILKLSKGNIHVHRQSGSIEAESTESMSRIGSSMAGEGQQYSSSFRHQTETGVENIALERKLQEDVGEMYASFIPGITVANAEDDLEYDDEYAMTASDPDETPTEGGVLKTAAEERAEKRKMKRFRLTHSQTRFLQSEFARQAHPDAAQRERLSKEIPGLSPRQVQVWFQNRRAKMKRLTSDDRERIMRSGALPEDFDTTQALHSNRMRSSQYVGGLPIVHSPSFMDNEDSLYHSLRRQTQENLTESPISMSSNMTDFYAASGPSSTAEMMSPVSITHETPHLSGSSMPRATNLHPTNLFCRSRSFPLIYQSQPHSPNLQVQDIACRRRAESLASPLGLNVPVSESSWDHGSSQIPDPHRSSSLSTSFNQPYMNLSTSTNFPPQNFQYSTVQNIFAPEIHLSLPPDGQWQSIQNSGISQSDNNTASLCPDVGTHARPGSLTTDRPNFYEIREQSIHLPQTFQTLQGSIPVQSSGLVTHFPPNYNVDSLRHCQAISEQERVTEEDIPIPYTRNSHFDVSDQRTANPDENLSDGDIRYQSEKVGSRRTSFNHPMD